ncbi:MAG: hypothetical protein ACTSRA_19730 [Promethearchaeota archaeon]
MEEREKWQILKKKTYLFGKIEEDELNFISTPDKFKNFVKNYDVVFVYEIYEKIIDLRKKLRFLLL